MRAGRAGVASRFGVPRSAAVRKAAELARLPRHPDLGASRLGRRARQLEETLVELAKDVALYAEDFDLAIRKLTEASARALAVERVSLWWCSEDRSKFTCFDLFEQSKGRHDSGVVLEAKDYPCYFAALDAARFLAVRDARNDPRTREYCEGYLDPAKITSMMDVPVRVGGRAVGILCHEHVGPRRSWTGDEQAFAASMADLVATLIEADARKRTQQDLRSALALLGATLEATADGILVADLEDRITKHNQKLLEILQMPEVALAARSATEAVALFCDQAADPKQARAKLRALRARPDAVEFDVLELADGRSVECYTQPQRLDGRIVGRVFSFRDVTWRRLAERERDALLEREKKARGTAELVAAATAAMSESLDYELDLNRLAQLCVQRRLADWCYFVVVEDERPRIVASAHHDGGQDLYLTDLRKRHELGPHDPAAKSLRTGRPMLLPQVDPRVLLAASADDALAKFAADGGVRSILAVPAVARGQVVGALMFCSAAPGRAYGDEDLALANELARRAANAIDLGLLHRRTEEAVRLRTEFLALASHELRTPLASLQLSLQALRRVAPAGPGDERPDVRRLLDVPERQTKRLARLVDTLLDVSRIESGRLDLDLEEVDLVGVAEDVATRHANDLERAGCAVSVRGSRVTGRWDRSRLDQVITNLLTNAMRYGAGRPIEILGGERDGWATLTLVDHGVGIAAANAARIFERFERGASGEGYPGLGLGLYISRAIAEAHGGKLECTSRVGAGSTFTLELPREGPPRRAAQRTSPAHTR